MKWISVLIICLFLGMPLNAQQGGQEFLFNQNGVRAAYNIKLTADNGYILTGFSNPTSSFFGQDIMMLKIDSTGVFEWSISHDAGGSMDIGESIIQTFENNYACVGWGSNPSTSQDGGYFLLTNNQGELLNSWFSNPIDGGGVFNDVVQINSDSSLVIVGKYNNNPYLVRTDKNGDTLFTKIYTDITGVFQVVTTSEDGQFLYLAGKKTGPTRGLILKTDLDGEIIWSHISDDVGFEELHNVFLHDGKLFSSGRAANMNEVNPSDFHLRILNAEDDSSPTVVRYSNSSSHVFRSLLINESSEILMVGTKSLGSGIGTVVYVVKTDIEGEIIWEREFGSNHSDNVLGWGICSAHDYGYMVCGQVVADGVPYVYVIKIDENGSVLSSNHIPIMPEISIYPNPCSEQLNIHLGSHEGEKQITIFNSNGQEVWHGNTTANDLQIDAVRYWQAGVYLVHIEVGVHKVVRKVVVE